MKFFSLLFKQSIYLMAIFTLILSFNPLSAEDIKISGSNVSLVVDSNTGCISFLEVKADGKWPGFVYADGSRSAAGIEVFDELERKLYSDRTTATTISNLQLTRIGTYQCLEFDKQFADAPFSVHQTITSDIKGVRLDCRAVLNQIPGGRWPRQRNVRISFVMPASEELIGWAPSYPEPAKIKDNPVRYCYGIQEEDMPRVGIPLYTAYVPGKAGLGISIPLEVRKVQLNLGPEPADPSNIYVDFEMLGVYGAGATMSYKSTPPAKYSGKDVQVIRLTEMFVGLTADRPLDFSVWLFSHAPHWRPALGTFAAAYPDYFGLDPKIRSMWGGRMGGNVHVTQEDLDRWKKYGATMAWLHTHFHRHGEFIPPESLKNPDYEFFCEPYSKDYPDNTVNKNRKVIDAYTDNGQAVFLYGFNIHCDTITVVQRGLASDMIRQINGELQPSYHDQPVMFFSPTSPYGNHQLRQMDLMIETYPRIMGIALDNWAYGGLDFAHDDGITMFDNRPAANVNFSQQSMIPEIAKIFHSSGRLVMINKSRTIESMKGADAMLSEARGAEIFAMFAYMCLDRHLHPNEYKAADDAEYAEYSLKYCIEWGGQLGTEMVTADPALSDKYYNLVKLLRNRTWVLNCDPLTLHEGTRGNIFRIHPDSPWNAGAVVIPVVRPDILLKDGNMKDGLVVKVRLPENDKLTTACWIGVEHSDKEVKLDIVRNGAEITLNLPPVGPAGIIKLVSE